MSELSELPAPDVVVQAVRPGVFFTLPDALPRGRHQLGRDEVVARQRERLLIAATELLAAHGYTAITTKEICRRAGLSLTAFYQCFDAKETCIFAAYDRFIAVLIERMLATPGDQLDSEAYVRAAARTYLDVLRADPVVARAFQVEMDALGPEARRRRREALTGMASLIRTTLAERDPQLVGDKPLEAFLAVVYGIRQIASDAIDQGDLAFADLHLEDSPWLSRFLAS